MRGVFSVIATQDFEMPHADAHTSCSRMFEVK